MCQLVAFKLGVIHMKKRTLILLGIFFVILFASPVFANFSDNFDSDSVGGLPSKWVNLTINDSTHIINVTDADYLSSPNSLFLNNAPDHVGVGLRYPNISGTIGNTISFSIKPYMYNGGGDGYGFHFYAYNDTALTYDKYTNIMYGFQQSANSFWSYSKVWAVNGSSNYQLPDTYCNVHSGVICWENVSMTYLNSTHWMLDITNDSLGTSSYVLLIRNGGDMNSFEVWDITGSQYIYFDDFNSVNPPVIPNLTACGSLNQSGKTYYLDSNVTNPSGDCIEIIANDIILDCQNNYIKDVDGFGIVGTALSNITIKNCRMENVSWNADAGIEFYGSDDILIDASDIRGTQQGHGVAFRNSTDTGITNSYVDVVQPTAGHGVFWYECDGMYAINNTLKAYTGNGGYTGLRPEYSIHGYFDNNHIYGRLALWELFVNDSVWINNYVEGRSNSIEGYNDTFVNNTIIGRDGFAVITYGRMTLVDNNFTSTYPNRAPLYFLPIVEGGLAGTNISSNIGNGLPIYYYENRTTDIVGSPDTQVLICAGCHDMEIRDMTLGSTANLGLMLVSNVTVRNVSVVGHSTCIGANVTFIDSKLSNGHAGLDCYWGYPESQPFSHLVFIDSEILNNSLADLGLINANVSMINTTLMNAIYGDSNSFISRYWYLTFSISGGYNPFNPHVIIKDAKNNTMFEGDSRSISLTALEYVGSCASPDCDNTTEARDYYTNYTINVSASSYNKPFAGIFDFSENNNFFMNLESKMTGTGNLLTDVGSGVGSFLSAITLGVTNMIVYIAIIMGVLSIFYAIAYVFKKFTGGNE